MTVFSDALASDFAGTILAIASVPLFIGLTALAVAAGRRASSWLDVGRRNE